MSNVELERALRNLDASTADLVRLVADPDAWECDALAEALERRAQAVSQLESVGDPAAAEVARGALAKALDHGAEAIAILRAGRRSATEEWLRLHRILGGMGTADGEALEKVDCRG